MKDGMTNGHAVGRLDGGRGAPGMSGNPSGWPVGARARYADKFLTDASPARNSTAPLRSNSCGLMLDATAEPGPLDGMTPEELQRLLELVRLAKAETIDNCET